MNEMRKLMETVQRINETEDSDDFPSTMYRGDESDWCSDCETAPCECSDEDKEWMREDGRGVREATISIGELMDEGILDPRQVADAALQYMSEAEVADMARMYEWFGDEDDDDAYEG